MSTFGKCPECGRTCRDGFCTYCGQNVEAITVITEAELEPKEDGGVFGALKRVGFFLAAPFIAAAFGMGAVVYTIVTGKPVDGFTDGSPSAIGVPPSYRRPRG